MAVEIYLDEVLGVGAYGKVCKAKYGQLPCAAKLLHDTLFQDNDRGTSTLARSFEQECQFLSNFKHQNIVQYLGTTREPRSHRPVLLMELMEESLTRFLERSTLGLPYHSQLNLCYDVILALAYLHSNNIIHRDISSNNVLLIGEGSRAKVTDFGMSKLTEMNPRMTPLTQCPGTSVYMPPEALITPPHYSSKLDIFSHGVLTIQVITRNFPNPGDATLYVNDPKYPSGHVLIQIPEADCRKKDIDLIEADHPLLLTALHCIKDGDTERPSADELCEVLVSLKSSARYRDSVEQTREQTSSTQRLQIELETKEQELQREKEDHQVQLEQIIEGCQVQYQKELQAEKNISNFLVTENERLTAELRDSQAREQQYRGKLEVLSSQTAFRSRTKPQEQKIGTNSSLNSERDTSIPVAVNLKDKELTVQTIIRFLKDRDFPAGNAAKLGLNLSLKRGKIDQFKRENPDLEEMLGAVIDYWLQNHSDKSWKKLAEALRYCDCNSIADEIQGERPPVNKRPRKGAEKRFPLLKLGSKEEEEQIEELESESEKICREFIKLVAHAEEALKNKGVSVKQLILIIKGWPFHKQKHNKCKLMETLKSLQNAGITEAFVEMSDYWSFFDYELLGDIIKIHSSALIPEFDEYVSKFTCYCKHRRCEVPTDTFGTKKVYPQKVKIKTDEIFDVPLRDVKRTIKNISSILDTSLHLIDIEEGCVELTFICLHELDAIFPLSVQQKQEITKFKILKIYSDTEVYYEQKYRLETPTNQQEQLDTAELIPDQSRSQPHPYSTVKCKELAVERDLRRSLFCYFS